MAADVAAGFPAEPPFSPNTIVIATYFAAAWYVVDTATQSQDRL